MLKRSITELKGQTKVLAMGIITLLVIFFIKQFEDRPAPPSDYPVELEKYVESINIILTVYGFIINLFPIT